MDKKPQCHPPFTHELLKEHLITNTSSKINNGQPNNFISNFPTNFISKQSATYSAYKNHNTAKGLLGISPAGYPTFVAELYAGCSSDKQITKDCGILNLRESGDQVMADRGFDIENEMPLGVGLNIPPFLDGAPQLSPQDEVKTRKIASLRVHVERAIQ